MSRYNHALLYTAGIYVIALFLLCCLPTTSVPAALRMSGRDKMLHAGAFVLLTVLLLEGVAARSSARRVWLVTAAALGIGALIEWTQILFGRTCALSDWLADVFGVLPGLAAWGTFCFLHAGLKRKEVAVTEGEGYDQALGTTRSEK